MKIGDLRRIALLMLCFLAIGAAWADHQKVLRGVVINLGIVPATKLAAFPAEGAHGTSLPGGSQHLLVSLSDAKSGRHLEAAKVSVQVTDPKGAVQRKDLILGRTGDIPDYSEIFMFGWSGKYQIRVTVQPKDGKPMRADFAWSHVV